jgi:hypothetical protein
MIAALYLASDEIMPAAVARMSLDEAANNKKGLQVTRSSRDQEPRLAASAWILFFDSR